MVEEIKTVQTDLLIIGAGIVGMRAALEAAKSKFRTDNQVIVNQQKSEHKQSDTILKSTLEK